MMRVPRAARIVSYSCSLLMGLHLILRTNPSTSTSFITSDVANNLSALVDFQPLMSTAAITNDPWRRELFERLDSLRTKCGNLCAINTLDDIDKYGESIPNPHGNFMSLKVPIHCPNILQLEEMDAGDASLPYPPPDELLQYYTMDGAIDFVLQKKFDNIYLGGEAKTAVWSKEYIDEQIEKLKTYRQDETYRGAGRCMLQKLKKWTHLKDKSVLVIGSERPWLEVIILSLGAAQVTTLEYGKIESHHPQVRAFTPDEFRAKAIDGTLGEFDGIISHSSIEHAGLGRYGDALNPYGDLLNVARAYCVTKSDGFLVLGLPTGRDAVQFNGARVYGKIRWPLLTANFVQMDGEDHKESEFAETYGRGCGGGQIFVFQKQ